MTFKSHRGRTYHIHSKHDIEEAHALERRDPAAPNQHFEQNQDLDDNDNDDTIPAPVDDDMRAPSPPPPDPADGRPLPPLVGVPERRIARKIRHPNLSGKY